MEVLRVCECKSQCNIRGAARGARHLYGTVEQSHFQEQYFLHNTELLELVARVKCSASAEANQRDAETYLCELDIILWSGE